jgi:NAD(P)-dependent dehydrogenase (short-subunit alcohol dehydrogenase family)
MAEVECSQSPGTPGTLHDRTAIVTGATGGGLGEEIARTLSSRGARVVVTGRSADAGHALAAELRAAGRAALFVRADLALEADCAALIEQAHAWGGSLDVLVNNAYLQPAADGAAWDVAPDVWHEAHRVNLYAPLLLVRGAAPLMRDGRGGSIVNVSSRIAQRSALGMTAYATSKAALEALTRAIAVDGAAWSIRCNAVAPGYLLGKSRDAELSEQRLARLAAMHIGPIPTVAEVADVVAFLASDESRSLTGAVLAVDAGGTIARAASFR